MQTTDIARLEVATPVIVSPSERPAPYRERLPDERKSITHKFVVGDHEGYIIVGLYPDGRPGEMFITIAKEGSTLSGVMDAFATAISLLLQYGVPLQVLADKFAFVRYEPSGFTKTPHILIAKSLTDYIFRWMVLKFGTLEEKVAMGIVIQDNEGDKKVLELPTVTASSNNESVVEKHPGAEIVRIVDHGDGVTCRHCGGLTRRNGSCHVCTVCGETTGCS